MNFARLLETRSREPMDTLAPSYFSVASSGAGEVASAAEI